MSVKIEVTQEDIDRGERKSAKRCPIARACLRAGLKNVEVDAMVECEGVKGDRLYGRCSLIEPFVEAFDAGNKVFPFSFEFEPEARCSRCDDFYTLGGATWDGLCEGCTEVDVD